MVGVGRRKVLDGEAAVEPLWRNLSAGQDTLLRPKRQLRGQKDRGGEIRPIGRESFWRNRIKSRRRGTAPDAPSEIASVNHRVAPVSTQLAECIPKPSEVVSDYRPDRGIRRYRRESPRNHGIRFDRPVRTSVFMNDSHAAL